MQVSFCRALRYLAIFSATSLAYTPFLMLASDAPDELHRGYYRDPALHGDTIIFTSEGDLWTVSVHGGASAPAHVGSRDRVQGNHFARRQDRGLRGKFEGPSEVYTMPIDGGLPQRRTWDGDSARGMGARRPP